MKIVDLFIARVCRRPPDFVIGGGEHPYMRRWWVIPRNRWFNIYLHHIMRPDDDRACHDHPWPNCSVVLRGGYFEVTPDDPHGVWRHPGSITFRRATALHRLDLRTRWRADDLAVHGYETCWSLFITGPRIREWGFKCQQGWVHWKDFTNSADGGQTVGKGCGE